MTALAPGLDGNLAARLREDLASARAAGVDFEDAWREAFERLGLDASFWPNSTPHREAAAWRAALAAARGAFRRAYRGEDAAEEELAARGLEELAAA